MKTMKLKFWWMALFLSFLASCSEENEEADKWMVPITFSSTIQPASTTHPDEEQWTDMLDRRIAIQIDEGVKKYLPDAQGNLTSTNPFYWEGRKNVTVNAWYPYNNGIKPETIVVKAQQNIEAYYQMSNIMETAATVVTSEEAKLTFVHRTTKLACLLNAPAPKTRASESVFHGARISLLNLQGVETGTTVNMSANHRAYIVPQSIPAGTEFMEIKLQDGRSYTYVMEENFNPEEAQMYEMELNVDPETGKIDFTVKESATWDGSDEDIKTESPTTDSEGSSSWEENGEKDDLSGDSSTTNPEGNGSWEGNGENDDLNGDSSTTNPEGNGSWEGNGENDDLNGDSSTTNPEGNGSWEGDSNNENLNGDSSTTNPEGNSSWEGDSNNENLNGDSSTTNPDGNSSWKGNQEDVKGESSDANPEQGENNGSWNGKEEDLNGTKKEINQ